MSALIPIHPCGVIVDVLRFAYETDFRFVPNGPTIRGRWFRTDQDAAVVDHDNAFTSLQWQGDWQLLHDHGQVGEVPGATRTWVQPLTFANWGYRHTAGPEEYWRNGATSVFLPLERNTFGVPLACGAGGEPPPPPVPSPCSTEPVPRQLWMHKVDPDGLCPCAPDHIEINYLSDFQGWPSADLPTPCHPEGLTFGGAIYCAVPPDVPGWRLAFTGGLISIGATTIISFTANPFELVAEINLVVNGGWPGCSGVIRWRVDDLPP